MKGRKNLRRAGIVLGLGALLCGGVMASGALGMALVDPGSTDSTSTAADTTTAASDSSSTDTTSSSVDTSTPTTTDTTVSSTTTEGSGTTTAVPSTPTVASDKADYAPGSPVTLNGSGWGSAEKIHIVVNDDVGQAWKLDADVFADIGGNFTYQFQLPNFFIADYSVTATGASGGVARTAFTDAADANNGEGTMTVSPVSVLGGSTTTFTFTFSSPNGKDFNSGSQATILVPAGWSQPRTSPAPQVNVSVAGGPGTPSCTSLSIGSITGSGPWTIPVNMTCPAKAQFTLTYSSATAPSPATATTYEFTTQTKQSGGTLTNIGTHPSVTVAAPTSRSTSTALALSTGANPSTYGDALAFTATVTATGGNPSSVGTVTFRDGTTVLCCCDTP